MTVSILQQVPADDGNGTTNTSTRACTLGTVTAGSTLVCFWTAQDGQAAPSISDSVNGAWPAAVQDIDDNGAATQRTGVSRFENSAAGTPTITATWPGNTTFKGVWGVEVGGAATSSALDGSNGQFQVNPAGTADAITSLAASNTKQPALVIGCCLENGAANTVPIAGTGFTSAGTGWGFGAAGLARLESLRITAVTSTAATFTRGAANSEPTTVMIIIDELGASGGGGAPAAPLGGHLSPNSALAPNSVSSRIGSG